MDAKGRDEGKEQDALKKEEKKFKKEKQREGKREGVFGQVGSYRWGLVRKV